MVVTWAKIEQDARRLNCSIEHLAASLTWDVKARRPPRPQTSPLVEVYREWERRAQTALLLLWQQRARRLGERLRADVKAVDDVLSDRDWWSEWTLAYLGVVLPLMEQAGATAADIAIASFLDEYALGLDVENTMLSVSSWARRYSGQLARGLTQTDKATLRRHLSAWVESSEDMPALIARVDSFLNNAPRARRIAVTEATRAYAEGHYAAWRESGVVTGVIWTTAADELVCPICRPLDGQFTALGGQEWRHFSKPHLDVGLSVAGPPAHPNCRCWTLPWVKELPR